MVRSNYGGNEHVSHTIDGDEHTVQGEELRPPHAANSLNDLFSQHYRALVAWCSKRCSRDLGDPEDFVHQAYLRCRRHWNSQRSSPNHAAAYMYRSLRWVALDAVRSQSRRAAHVRAGLPPGQARGSSLIGEAVALEAVQSLTGRQREVCLAVLAGMSDAEIQSQLQLSPGALSVSLCRARASLCEFLEPA